MYIHRSLTSVIEISSQTFPVVLLSGPRQVGKTTLLRHCAEKGRNYVSLDDMGERELAMRDPGLFLQKHQAPVIIDEVQYAPQLFNAIKLAVDQKRTNGSYWLTGSQKFHLMQGITESLAGRVAILDLLGFSQDEQRSETATGHPFLPTESWLTSARKKQLTELHLMELYHRIWLGSMPQILTEQKTPRDIFYNSYVQTYIQRDVRALTRIGDEVAFSRFLSAAAARTGQLLNYAGLAGDADIDLKTAKSWISILESSGIIYLLQPYHNNTVKRLVKTPKLYFLDTGLCAYLTRWSTPESLEAGAMSGAFLETWIFSEILKSYLHNGKQPYLYFYRDRDQREIDLLIDENGALYPIEFKKATTPGKQSIRHFKALARLKKTIGSGAVISLVQTDLPITEEITAIPVRYL